MNDFTRRGIVFLLLILAVTSIIFSCGKVSGQGTQPTYELKCYSGDTLIFIYVGSNSVQTTSSGFYKVTKDGKDYTISLGCILKESY